MEAFIKNKSKIAEVPVGCVITDINNNFVSKSRNLMIKNNDPNAHAEILCIRKACKKLKSQIQSLQSTLIFFKLFLKLLN